MKSRVVLRVVCYSGIIVSVEIVPRLTYFYRE
jgi:hypothetical protein